MQPGSIEPPNTRSPGDSEVGTEQDEVDTPSRVPSGDGEAEAVHVPVGSAVADHTMNDTENMSDHELLDDDDESNGPEGRMDIPVHRSEDIERIFAGLPEAKIEIPGPLAGLESPTDTDDEVKVESELDDESIPVLIPIDNIL